jgi:hypothetical protein
MVTGAALVLAWALMVSYQIFTQTAVSSIAAALNDPLPQVANWLNSSAAVTTFICGFAWMFVLSAIVEVLMFGRERRLSIQFLVSLGLTAAGSAVLALLGQAGLDFANPNMLAIPFSGLFSNLYFSFFYLALPFIFMLVIDYRAVLKKRRYLRSAAKR